MRAGVVLKAYGGYCFVDDGGARLVRCTLRGRLQTRGMVIAGDRVRYTPTQAGEGVVGEVLPRRNALHRPVIANVDRLVVVVAVCEPDPVPNLMDRILVTGEAAAVTPLICLNKADLSPDRPPAWTRAYKGAGYKVILTSARTGAGVDALLAELRRRISVFAGPSGAGKSSLINRVLPGLDLRVGAVSRRLGRGRHITRHVELFRVEPETWVADAPGFSTVRLPPLAREELADCFPEMRLLRGRCRFDSCLHDREPGCAVKQAVEAGTIAGFRYRNYIEFLQEVMDAERRY